MLPIIRCFQVLHLLHSIPKYGSMTTAFQMELLVQSGKDWSERIDQSG